VHLLGFLLPSHGHLLGWMDRVPFSWGRVMVFLVCFFSRSFFWESSPYEKDAPCFIWIQSLTSLHNCTRACLPLFFC
jgi:hypothetical protein